MKRLTTQPVFRRFKTLQTALKINDYNIYIHILAGIWLTYAVVYIIQYRNICYISDTQSHTHKSQYC